MNEKQFTKLVSTVVDGMMGHLRKEVQDTIRGEIEQHRRAVYVRSDWCCNNMRHFALEVWHAPKPKSPMGPHGPIGSVRYELKGYPVNYCPFCGAHVGKPES